MSAAPPTGFPSASGLDNSTLSASSLTSDPLANAPYGGPAVCTLDDPTGAKHTPAPGTQSNGTKGRVVTELRAYNGSAQDMDEQGEAFRQAMNAPKVSVYAGGSIAGFDGRGELGDSGLSGSWSAPTGYGTSIGSDGLGYSVDLGGKEVPKVYAGVCVAYLGTKSCFGLQTPSSGEAGVTINPQSGETTFDASGGIFQGSFTPNSQ